MTLRPARILGRTLVAVAALTSLPAFAQDDPEPTTITPSDRNKPELIGQGMYELDFVDKTLYDFTVWIADLKRMNFVIGDPKDLQGKKVTIISHKKVSVGAVFEAYLAALEVNGFSLSVSGTNAKIVKAGDASQYPIPVNKGGDIPYSDRIVTQLIPLENVSVGDVNNIITGMASPGAKVVAYNPANTVIITDVAHNLRKIYEVLSELDVAAPKSTLEIVPVNHADAAEIKQLIEELYGTAESAGTNNAATARNNRRNRRTPRNQEPQTEATTAGKAAKYIDKVLADERTNSLIVLANEQGHQTVRDLLEKLDVDSTGLNESRIYVVRLENAKADEVSSVLQELSNGGRGGGQTNNRNNAAANNRNNAANARNRNAAANAAATTDEEGSGAIAAFDSGMRIASDENTNSLVIIARPADYEVVKKVIDELDMERRQVFVDATILEIASEDTFQFGIAAHLPSQPNGNTTAFAGAQLESSSLGLTQDALSGLAVGVFGPLVSVPINTGLGVQNIDVPAFGIALNALRTNNNINIVSNPTLMTLDNEEATIIVGRKVPFPTQSTVNQLTGIPIQSFNRQDVAITLTVTPRINSSNQVTLEITVEVQELEEEITAGAGPTTSQRKVETVVLVGDNQTAVLGGLVANTTTKAETKLPVLGDLPLVGVLFRGSRDRSRKSNLMVFLTPHIIDDPEDIVEVQRVKEAQRQEFLRRFYGRSRDEQLEELQRLMQFSINYVDEPSVWRGPTVIPSDWDQESRPLSDETIRALEDAQRDAGELPAEPPVDDDPMGEPPPPVAIPVDDGGE
ncbi:MAG: type II secretion system secretin GspD [Alphaproteobacteria bacterium]|nr:type II secretion system secretin GspD [Alphaproteobacteria bacterium]